MKKMVMAGGRARVLRRRIPSGVADELSWILPQIQDARDDDSAPFDCVEDPIGKSLDQQAPVASVEERRYFWKRVQLSEGPIQMAHENLSASCLIRFVKMISGLDIDVSGEKKYKFTHRLKAGQRRVSEWPPMWSLAQGLGDTPPYDDRVRQFAPVKLELPSDALPSHPKAH
jgi:hypothetical protein